MTTLIIEKARLYIPAWVIDLASFRRWTDEPDFPQTGKVWWLRGGVWADMSKEQIFSHNLVRTKITTALDTLVDRESLGLILSDGVLFCNEEADLSGNPDATFISNESRKAGRVTLKPGKEEGFTELHGSPDMVLEVVSDSSEEKDLITLREDYFTAGVREYWLVDARKNPPKFDILRRNSTGFVNPRKQDGWAKSLVFGKAFRLVRTTDALGTPTFRLEVR